MYVTEFTLHAKPGHFEQLAEIHSEFAAEFLSDHPALQTVLVVGDEASGMVRGIGVYTDREAAEQVNSDPEFASYNDRIARSWQAHRNAWSYSSCTTTRAERPGLSGDDSVPVG